jgi:hypothetical protein
MTVWNRLAEIEAPVSRGQLVRCFRGGVVVVLMVRESWGLITLTGRDAGVDSVEFPTEAQQQYGLSARWLADHMSEYVSSDPRGAEVRGKLAAEELATEASVPLEERVEPAELGCVLECRNFGYPFETVVNVMVTRVGSGLGLMTITGYKAGIAPWWVAPAEAVSGSGLDAGWLRTQPWRLHGARVEDVRVRLTTDALP